MGYCREHLSKQRSFKKAGTVVLLVVGIFLALFGGFMMFAFSVVEHSPGLGGYIAVALVLVLPDVVCLWLSFRQMGKNRALANPENSRLVQSIRRQLPAEQAKLPLEQVFALVDRDLSGGEHFGNAILGTEWVLLADLAVRTENIRGIIMNIHGTRSAGVYISNYEVTVCNERRECASTVFLDSKKAEACLAALRALAPEAARGGNLELVQMMSMSDEALQTWNEKFMKK